MPDTRHVPALDDHQSPAAATVTRPQPPTGASTSGPAARAAPRRPERNVSGVRWPARFREQSVSAVGAARGSRYRSLRARATHPMRSLVVGAAGDCARTVRARFDAGHRLTFVGKLRTSGRRVLRVVVFYGGGRDDTGLWDDAPVGCWQVGVPMLLRFGSPLWRHVYVTNMEWAEPRFSPSTVAHGGSDGAGMRS